MGDRKPLSKNRANKTTGKRPRTGTRIPGYLAGKRKRIKAAKVDPEKEKQRRLLWYLKWAFLLPLSAYALVWLLVIFIDFFKY